MVHHQDRLGLYAVGMLVLLAIAMVLSALFGAPARGRHAGAFSEVIFKTPWHGSVPARERTARPVPGNVLQDMCGSNPHRAPFGAAAPQVTIGGKTPRSGATGIQHSENDGNQEATYLGATPPGALHRGNLSLVTHTETRPILTVWSGESRSRDRGESSAFTLVAEQSAHLSGPGRRSPAVAEDGFSRFSPRASEISLVRSASSLAPTAMYMRGAS